MSPQGFQYLQAELAIAQQTGQTKVLINAKELQAVIGMAKKYMEMDARPKKLGYANGDEVRNVCDGQANHVKVLRYATRHRNTPVFFFEIEGDDTRPDHQRRRQGA